MSDLTYGDYVYLNENDEIPKKSHNFFIKKQEPHIAITSPMIILKENLKILPEM